MITKRGRKRKNEMYFGPEEEEAVINFLDCRYVEVTDFKALEPNIIFHNLGSGVTVSVNFLKENENSYGKDDKFITIDVDIITSALTNESVMVITKTDVNNANVVITDEIKRNLIFNEWLKKPLDKMIESIIRKYKLYRKGESFEELHTDTSSFLLTKIHKFDSVKGKKAYSYFGTISKNYILGLLIKDDRYVKKTIAYDDVSEEVEEMDEFSYVIDEEEFVMDDFILKIIDGLKEELKNDSLQPRKKLSENEKKVGYALIDILENWETAFESMNGGSKYNKNSVLETMRNYTNLSTKDIRLAMKRFKELYQILKNHGL